MRSSPAFRITIDRFGVWRGAVAGLTTLALAALSAWVATADVAGSPAMMAGVGSIFLGTVVCGISLLRCRSVDLRWDTQCWYLATAPDGTSAGAGTPGALTVAIDLGAWMLLKFETDAATRRRRVAWLPVQRRGMEARWHALRCAVYCARSAPGADAGLESAISQEQKNERP